MRVCKLFYLTRIIENLQLRKDNFDEKSLEKSREYPRFMRVRKLFSALTRVIENPSELDAIILGQAGGAADRGNVLGAYQYCAFAFVSPYATSGTLEGYVKRRRDGLSPEEMYDLSLQAARGLARTHPPRPDGVATFAHTDIKPLQFLLFDRGDGEVPELRLNDFNRGFLLGYDARRGGPCQFDMCAVRPNGSMYRSPEEWRRCADQDDRVDVYALGGVIYFIVSGGLKPWHYATFKMRRAGLEEGKTSMFPGDEGYSWEDGGLGRRDRKREARGRGRGKGAKAAAEKRKHPDGRLDHPAVRALREVVARCWAYRPEDRPSSLEVLRMLEDGLEKFH